MPHVSITINGRAYPVACNDGEEERIRELARGLDERVAGFARQFGQAGEARLLVLAALVMADELAEAHETVRRLGTNQPVANPPVADQLAIDQPVVGQSAVDQHAADQPGLDHAAIAGDVDRLAQRVEAVAARLETSQI